MLLNLSRDSLYNLSDQQITVGSRAVMIAFCLCTHNVCLNTALTRFWH